MAATANVLSFGERRRDLDPAATTQLVSQAKRGDRDAFAALIRRYERTALAVAYAAAGDAESAGDVTQESFLRAWQRLPALKDDGKFATWLCGIVRNVSVDLARRRTRDERHRDVRPRFRDEEHDPISEIESREQSIHIDQALWRLDDVSRTMVVLRYYENLPSDRIADLLATTPAAVDMRLSRARQTLRCLLEPANEDVTR